MYAIALRIAFQGNHIHRHCSPSEHFQLGTGASKLVLRHRQIVVSADVYDNANLLSILSLDKSNARHSLIDPIIDG